MRFASLPRIFVFLFRNVTFVTSSEKCFQFVPCTFSKIGLFQKKTNLRKWGGGGGGGGAGWGIEGMEFLGVPKKRNAEFPKVS